MSVKAIASQLRAAHLKVAEVDVLAARSLDGARFKEYIKAVEANRRLVHNQLRQHTDGYGTAIAHARRALHNGCEPAEYLKAIAKAQEFLDEQRVITLNTYVAQVYRLYAVCADLAGVDTTQAMHTVITENMQ